MIKLIVHKGVHCFGLPSSLKQKVMQELSFKNPVYQEAIKYGRWISPDTPAILRYYSTQDDIIYVPRGYIHRLKYHLKNVEHEIEDRTLRFNPMKFEFKGECRDYQTEAVNRMYGYPIGLLEAGTGSGKTVMALKLIQMRGQPTLIIVHTKELLDQWQDRIKQFLDYDCGLIGAGKCDVKAITVGIINSVAKKTEQLQNKFGHIICDECHRCPSKTWTDTLQEFPAKYYLGLSATMFRRDKLGILIPTFIGPRRHTVSKEHLHDIGAVLKPKIFRIKTDFFYNFQNDYSSMISTLTKDNVRNDLIVRAIYHDVKTFKRAVLVVSDRKRHCSTLQRLLSELNVKSEVLTSGVSAGDRQQIVEDLRSGKCKVLISTIQLIGEGFDAPGLHALFITTPVKFDGRIIQIIGRILRPEDEKEPRVFDFRDVHVKPLLYSGFSRDRLYKRQWGVG